MDKPLNTLIPLPDNDSDVAVQAPVPPVDLGFSRDGIMQAAKDYGMAEFKPERLSAAHILGTAFKKVGVIKMGRAMLYSAAMHAETGAEQCQQILAESNDPEVRAALLPTKLGFAKELREVANSFIRSAELDGNDDADNKPRVIPFGAGKMAGPSQVIAQQAVVNINTNESNAT